MPSAYGLVRTFILNKVSVGVVVVEISSSTPELVSENPRLTAISP